MVELKRPPKIDVEDNGMGIDSMYSKDGRFYGSDEMDSFLSQVAEKLKEARKKREKSEEYECDFDEGNEFCKHCEFDENAKAIEEEVIKKLRGGGE